MLTHASRVEARGQLMPGARAARAPAPKPVALGELTRPLLRPRQEEEEAWGLLKWIGRGEVKEMPQNEESREIKMEEKD